MKIRPSVIIITLGLVIALNVLIFGIIKVLTSDVSLELFAALIAFGGSITTVLGTSLAKLVESEESTSK